MDVCFRERYLTRTSRPNFFDQATRTAAEDPPQIFLTCSVGTPPPATTVMAAMTTAKLAQQEIIFISYHPLPS